MLRLLMTILFSFALASVALAQSATPEDERACSASVQRYCRSVVQGGDLAILACLQRNRSRIARSCQQVLIKYGQ